MTLQDENSSAQADVVADVHVSDGLVLVTLAGELDVSRAEELREQLAHPVVLSARAVRLDLSRVSFLDSVIIGVIVTACKRVRAAESSFSVVCELRGMARRVFEIDGLVEYLQVEGPSSRPSVA
jgi:anti-sigma B factor antagonist